MKKIIVPLAFSLFGVFSSTQAVTLVGYDLPTSTTNKTQNPMPAATGVIPSAITAGTGLSFLTNNTSSSRWQASSFNQTGQDDTALGLANTGGDYWAFSVTADSGYNLTINGVGSFQWGIGSSGPKNMALIYSADSTFSSYTILARGSCLVSSTTNLTSTWNAALAAAPVSVPEGTTAYFRIVGYGASSTSGTGGMLANLSAPDFSILGDVVSTSPLFTWTGGSGNWAVGVSANWQNGGVASAWQNNQDASFTAGGNLTVDSGGVAAKAISITGSSPVTWLGGAVSATALSMGSGSSLSLAGSNEYNIGALDVTDATISGGKLSGTSFSITVGTGSITLSSVLSGNASFFKLGSGELVLSAAMANTVTSSISAGILTTGAGELLSDTATLKVDNTATLKLGGNETVGALYAVSGSFINLQGFTLTSGYNGGSFTNGATITGLGGLVKNGSGQMYLNNSASTYSGGFVLNSGEVAYTTSGSAGNGVITNAVFGTGPVTLNGGTLTSSSAASGRNLHNNIFLNGDVQFGTTAWGTTNVTMNLSTKIDTNSTSNNVSFSQNPMITVSTNANGSTTLQKDSTINTIAYVDWYQPINGNYRITKSGTGAYTLFNNYLQLRASNNIAGVTVSSGLLTYKNRNAFGSGTLVLKDGVAIGQDGTINNTPLTGNDQIDRSLPNDISIEGNVAFGTGSTANHLGGNINLNGGNRSITVINTTYLYGTISNGALTVFDTSPNRTLHLLASNSYADGTTHNGGILSLGHDSALGGGGLTVFSNNSYTNVSTNISATVSGGVTNYTATNYTTNVTVASNRLTINSDRTLTNNISLNSGALYTIEAPQLVTTTVDSGTGVTNSITNNATFVINGSISGAGAILKSGQGLLRLTGALSYSGDTAVSSGTLERVTNNISASITTNTIAVTFSNTPAVGDYRILPGSLSGTYTATFPGLSATRTATFAASNSTVTVAAVLNPPRSLSYTPSSASGQVGQAITILVPSVTGTVTNYSVSPALPSGLSINSGTGVISGTPSAASSSASYTVTAANADGSTTASVTIAVSKGTPTISSAPTASGITQGQSLASSTLTGGSASVDGTFAWTDSSITPAVGTSSQGVTFTPKDSTNYSTITTTADVMVTSSGPSFADAYPGKNLTDVAPNGLTYLVNYAFGGSSSNAPTLPTQDTADPAKLALVAIVRTNDTNVSVVGEAAGSLTEFSNPTTITSVPGSTSNVSQVGVPTGCQRQKFSVDQGSADKKFLRLKATK